MPLSEAQALSEQTSLQTTPKATPTDSPAPPYLVAHDPQADRLVLEKLAQWCEQFSPVVALPHDVPARGPAGEPCHPECLYLDVTHLGPLFGGEQNLAQQVVRAFAERGYHARLALADTLGAAWAVSHFDLRRPTTHPVNQHPVAHEGSPNWQCRVVPVGKTFSAVQALPVAALRLPPGTVATLQQLGISQIGQLAQLPRSSLSSRFGDELLRQFDLLLGRSREVLVPYRPPPVFHADWQLDYPTTNINLINDTQFYIGYRSQSSTGMVLCPIRTILCQSKKIRSSFTGIDPHNGDRHHDRQIISGFISGIGRCFIHCAISHSDKRSGRTHFSFYLHHNRIGYRG